MSLRKTLRKIIPKEIRDNPIVAVVAVAALGPAALGVIGSSIATVAGATVGASTATAIALGTGAVTTGVTFLQTGDVSDSLKAGVLSGAGSYIGSTVSSAVTNAVAAETGASLVDLEPALRGLSGEGPSAAGVAAITAGNIAGSAAYSAITGRPIQEGAVLGLGKSIPTVLSASADFKSLNPVVQEVISSSSIAALTGQDVGQAALSSLVQATNIVGKAIESLPGGVEFVKLNPIATKYIVDSLSSALVAKLQNADVSESVLNSLVRTTASVLGREMENAQRNQYIKSANQKYNQALDQEKNLFDIEKKLEKAQTNYNNLVPSYNSLMEKYYSNVNQAAVYYEWYQEALANNDPSAATYAGLAKEYFDIGNKANNDSGPIRIQLNQYEFEANNLQKLYENELEKYNALVQEVQNDVTQLTRSGESLVTDFSTELETTLAPLTAFQDETVPDQDILAEIQSVAPPDELFAGGDTSQLPVVNPQIAQEIQNKQQEIESINKKAMEMAFSGSDVAAFPALAVSIGGHAALAAYIWLSEKYNELFPDPETAKAALEQSPQAQQFVTIIKMELNKTPEVKIKTNPVTQKKEAKVTVPDTLENPLSKETKEFIERIEADIKTPSDAAKFNADNIYDELVKIFGEKNVSGAGQGGGADLSSDIESIISGEGLVPEDVTEVVTDTTLPSDVQLPIVVTPTVAGGTAGGETIPQTPVGEVTDQEIKDVINQQTPTVIGGEGEAPITPTLPIGGGETTVGGGEAPTTVTGGETPTTIVGGEVPTTVTGGETPTTVAGGEAETTVTGGQAPTTVDTITGGDVAKTGQASVPGGEISDEEIINIIVGEGNVPSSGELPATTVVGGEEAPTTVVGGEDTTPGGLPDETITGDAGADTVVGGGDQVVDIAPTVPGGEQIAPTIPGGGEITPTLPGGDSEISDEDLINIIIGEGTPTTAGGGGEDTVVGGGEVPTVPGGEQVLPTMPGGDVTDILQPTLPGGAGEGDTVVSGGGEADTVLGGGGEGEATLPGGEGEDTIGGGLGDGEITDQDIINIITGGDTGVGGGGEDTTLAGGDGDKVAPTIPGGDDEAILDLIRDLEQEEGMEEIPLEPETPVEEVTPPTTGTRPVVTVVPRQRTFQRPGEAAPYRVTGQDESGILGRKQPLFGGDEDLQRAEWNRRSLRLRRLLGL